MERDSESYIRCCGYVDLWWNHLKPIILGCLSEKRRPVLVALSRKMPRLVSWFKKYFPDLANCDRKLLDEIEMTTELAVPFICLNSSAAEVENIDFIIVDDVIAHGRTLAKVADLVYGLTQRLPAVSCLAMADDIHRLPKVRRADFDLIPRVGMEVIDELTDFVSSRVEETNLPVDMEFPVFILSHGLYGPDDSKVNGSDVFEQLTRNLAALYSDRMYFVTDGTSRISLELKPPLSEGMVDFSKMRYFLRNDGEIVMELFAPNIVSEYSLVGREVSPFTVCDSSGDRNNSFGRIWNDTTSQLRHQIVLSRLLGDDSIAREIVKSLAVWCNYLLSLSAFSRQIESIIPMPELLPDIRLSKESLALIVGRAQADEVYGMLADILIERSYVESRGERASGIPTVFVPEELAEMVKYNRLAFVMISDSLEEALEDIFSFMHFNNMKSVMRTSVGKHKPEVGETYDSLLQAIAPIYKLTSHPAYLKRWVDAQIDAGRIIPRYERVAAPDGTAYWRRFFFAGLRRFPAAKEDNLFNQ